MNFGTYSLCLMAILFSQQAAAIKKCTGPHGKVTFRVPPAERRRQLMSSRPQVALLTRMRPASNGAAASPPTDAARLEVIVAASQRDRRARDLREGLVPEAERALAVHRDACAEKQKTLASQQYIHQQNLYGKTHAAQIASEMGASAAACDTTDRQLKEALDALTKECAALKMRPVMAAARGDASRLVRWRER